MNDASRLVRLVPLALTACLSASVGCSGAGPVAEASTTSGGPATEGSLTSPYVSVLATVPSGVQCVVATVTGADSETVSAPVAAGASSVALSFGALASGAVTFSANAYGTACPGSGAPAWVAEPVQASVVAGVSAQLQLVLRPAAQAAGSAAFSLPAIAIAAGPRTSYAVLSDGTVRAWGANEAGEFGSAAPATGSTTPVVVPTVTNAVQIAAGTNYACVIRTDSSVMCWGLNAGQFFGVPAGTTPLAPVVSPGLYATQISALGESLAFLGVGADGTVGVLSNTDFLAWGPSGSNGLSIGVAVGVPTASGAVGFCAVSEGGSVTCNWGTSGQVAPASRVYMGADYGTGVTNDTNNACAILDTGTVECWGANGCGELGVGSESPTITNVVVPGLTGVTSMALSRGSSTWEVNHTCAVSNGAVLCTGANGEGQLGNDTIATSTTFVPVLGLGSGVVTVAAGQGHTCALDNEGTVRCWGYNADGEIGDGTTTTRFAPVAVTAW